MLHYTLFQVLFNGTKLNMLHYTLFQVLFNGIKLNMLHYTLCFRYCSTVKS